MKRVILTLMKNFLLLKAWLKFYVTDHLLTKSVEEPNWFEGDLYTTESMSRLNNTTPYFHESSIELVNGII